MVCVFACFSRVEWHPQWQQWHSWTDCSLHHEKRRYVSKSVSNDKLHVLFPPSLKKTVCRLHLAFISPPSVKSLQLWCVRFCVVVVVCMCLRDSSEKRFGSWMTNFTRTNWQLQRNSKESGLHNKFGYVIVSQSQECFSHYLTALCLQIK